MRPLSGVVDLSISGHLLCYYVLESDVSVEVNNVESRVRVRPLPENLVDEWVNYISGCNFDEFLNGDLSQNYLSSFLTLLYGSYDRFLPPNLNLKCLARIVPHGSLIT